MANQLEHTHRTVLAVPNPAPGADILITPQRFGAFQVLGLVFTLVTSAAIANRQVTLAVDDGTTVIWRAVASQVQAATATVNYQVHLDSAQLPLTAGLTIMSFPAEGVYLRRGWHFKTVTGLIDVADQFSGIGLYVQELYDGDVVVQEPTVPYTEYALNT